MIAEGTANMDILKDPVEIHAPINTAKKYAANGINHNGETNMPSAINVMHPKTKAAGSRCTILRESG